MIERILNLFRKEIKKEGEMKATEVDEMLSVLNRDKKGVINLSKAQIILTDTKYNLPNLTSMIDFLKKDLSNFKFYRADEYDCDDFAVRLWAEVKKHSTGMAFGIVFSYGHVYNVFIDSNKNLWFVEPQTDKIMDLEDIQLNKKYFPVKFVII